MKPWPNPSHFLAAAFLLAGLASHLVAQTAEELNARVRELYQRGQYEQAATLAGKIVELRKAEAEKKPVDYAISLNNAANMYYWMGAYEKAEPLHIEAKAIWAKVLGVEHPQYATSLNSLAVLYNSMGAYEKAEPLYLEANAIRAKVLGEAHPEYAASLVSLAALYQEMGAYEKAESLYLKAKAIIGKALGEEHPEFAISINNLATLHYATGAYEKAEPLFLEAKAICAKVLGVEHPQYATSLHNLAALYDSMGAYEKAAALYLEAEAIRAKVLGEEHPDYATGLIGLAELYRTIDAYEKAEPLYLAAKAIRARVLGEEHPDYATSLYNLAELYREMGAHEKAEPLYLKAKAIRAKVFGEEHPDYATSLNGLAALYKVMGAHEKAEPLYLEAKAIYANTVGEEHPHYVASLEHLTSLYSAMHLHEKAVDVGGRAWGIEYGNLRRVLNYFTEAQLLSYAASMYSYNLAGYLGSGGLASVTQLQAKGLVMEAMGRRQQLLATLAGDSEAEALLAERDRLGAQYLKARLEHGEVSNEVEVLKVKLDAKERQIHQHLKEAGGSEEIEGKGDALLLVPPEVSLEQVKAVLSNEVRLLQGIRYGHRLKGDQVFEDRYAWTVVGPDPDVEPLFVSLGSASAIEAAISEFRAFFRADGRGIKVGVDRETSAASQEPVRESLETLYRLIWQPLESANALDGVTTVVVSGDSQLHFVPFGTLIPPGNQSPRFLCQDYAIRYVNSGRDLVAVPRESSSSQRIAVLVGNPNYQAKWDAEEEDDRLPEAALDGGRIRRNLFLGMDADSREMTFLPLPGTKEETRVLREMLEVGGFTVESLSEEDATEPALRNAIQRPDILHMATHGFFLPPPKERVMAPATPGPSFAPSSTPWKPGDPLKPIQDPMLRSGLALSGAQNALDAWKRRETLEPAQDGLLLAAESATLDLRGTKLVVMSACSTAEGKAMDGEGVMGLRRALAVAGAETVVMSLWPVDDEATVELMERFYARYLDGMHPARALDETRRDLLVEHAKTEGVARAVYRYGPFIATSIGPVSAVGTAP